MAGIKKKTAFFCQECGYEAAKWTGQCPACKAQLRVKNQKGEHGVRCPKCRYEFKVKI